jgi:xanthine dehydrogenase accessory factor
MPLFYRTTSPDKVFDEFGLDGRTAVVFANHDFESSRDHVARVLLSDAGYVGMIGSSRQRASKEEWLRANGIGNTDITRFRSPIGVPVGKSSPVAIAISVIAEILHVMDQRVEQMSAAHPDG